MGYSPCHNIWVGWTVIDLVTYSNQNNIEDLLRKLDSVVVLGEQELNCCFEKIYTGDTLLGYGIVAYHVSAYDGNIRFNIFDLDQNINTRIIELKDLICKYKLPEIKINIYNFATLS